MEMERGGIYTCWHYFRKGEVSGQIATLVTLVIAVVFLFVAVTVNISRVAQKKTVTANAADGAAMKLASYLGSYANMLSLNYVNGGVSYCERHYGMLMFGLMTGIFMMFLFPPLVDKIGLGWAAAAGLGVQSLIYYNYVEMPQRIVERLQRQLAALGRDVSFTEQAILYALSNAVDDPVMVVDDRDYDEDGDTGDMISRFAYWYASERMDEIAGVVPEVSEEVQDGIEDFLPILEEFVAEVDGFRGYIEDETRVIYDWDPETGEPVITHPEASGEFLALLEELNELGIELPFWTPGADNEDNSDHVDSLSASLHNFYDFGSSILEQDFESAVASRQYWRPMLYNTGGSGYFEGEGWYHTWARHIVQISGWIGHLYAAHRDIMMTMTPEQAADPGHMEYLLEVRAEIVEAIERLTELQRTLGAFNGDILRFYAATTEVIEESPLLREATYSWEDSLGWHHVRVEASEFTLPSIYIRRHKRWYGSRICVYLLNYTGDVSVDVTRYDQAQDQSYFSNGVTPLWRFRYSTAEAADPSNAEAALAAGIRSSGTARYNFAGLPGIIEAE